MIIMTLCAATIVAVLEPSSHASGGRAAPTITATKPGQVYVGQPSMTFVVRGTGFSHNAVIRWNGSDSPTTYVSDEELRTTIAATELASTRTVQVTVFVQGGNGGLSNTVTFRVVNPPPTIASITPSSATVGGRAFTLVVDGSNFVPGASIRWNGVARATTVASNSRLTAAVTTADLIRGPVQVTVANPQPGGGTSTSLTFSMIEPAPVAVSPVPASPTPASVDAITTVSIAADPPPDLEVKIAQTASTVVAGTQQKYTVKVFNRGGLVARSVVLRAALPPDLEYVSSGADHYFVCSRSGATLNCPSGVIAARDSANIQVTMKLATTATSGHPLVFGATADPDRAIPESNEYNNSAAAAATTQAAPSATAATQPVSTCSGNVADQVNGTVSPRPNSGAPIIIPVNTSKSLSFTICSYATGPSTVFIGITAATDLLGAYGELLHVSPPEFKAELIDPSGTVVETKSFEYVQPNQFYGVGHYINANGVWRLKITNLKTPIGTMEVRGFISYAR